MGVTANNIANSQTEGYTRQRLRLSAAGFGLSGNLLMGGGVLGEQLQRIRDPFLDASFRRENSYLGSSGTMRYILGQVEAVMQEPSDVGIGAAIDELFQAFGDLSNDPSSNVQRDQVRRAAETFVQRLRHLNQSLQDQMEQGLERMRHEVDQVNEIAAEIAYLNDKILSVEGAMGTSPDLLDQRDLLLDRLSGFISVRVTHAENGSVTVMAGDLTLVTGGSHQSLAVKPLERGGFGLGLASGDGTMDPQAGSLKALSDLTSITLPEYATHLDTLAQAVVTEINALHRTGYTLGGETNIDFFDPGGVTAGTISISDALRSSLDNIAAGLTPEAGDNELALQLAALGQAAIESLDGETFHSFYTVFATGVGRSVRDAMQDEIAAQALVDHAEAWRSSVAGVSVDEEMVNLITQQEAYTAAARLVSVADQMIQEMLRMIT
jgi:flagellar hook-associated protein 1 FlgK